MKLTDTQVVSQLQLIKKFCISEHDEAKNEALERAIKIMNIKIWESEPCFFDEPELERCRVLTKRDCFKCSFKCTEKEFKEAQDRTKEKLEKRGLKVVRDSNGDHDYITVVPIDNGEEKW